MRTNSQILKSKNPHLLVIGGSGRLGTLLRRAWQSSAPGGRCGAPNVVWQGRRNEDFPAFGGPALVFDPLAEPEALAAAAQAADVILNLAGVVFGPPESLALNRILAEAVVLAAGERPVILASSAAVYGAGTAGQGPCRETDPPAPLAPYGAAKLEMERAVAGQPGVTVLRIGNVAGADALLGAPPPERGRVLDILPDGGAPQRSYIGPQALARAVARLVRLAAARVALPEVLNLALPGAVGMDHLLEAAGEGWQSRPAPGGVIGRVELDVARAVGLGLVPDTPATAAGLVDDLRAVWGRA